MHKVRATLTVLLSVACTAFAGEAKSQASKEIVVQTTIPGPVSQWPSTSMPSG